MYQAHPFTSAPTGFDTIKAVGRNVPNDAGDRKLGVYCKVPCGNTVAHRRLGEISTPLHFNEYIVFDQDRIRIKFIVHCERNGSVLYNNPSNTAPSALNCVIL